MRYYVYHYEYKELDIPGVYQQGEPETPSHRPPHWIDIPDEQFGAWILNLSLNYDVMLLGGNRIFIDGKGKRFSQR